MVLEAFTPAQTRAFLSQALHGIPISEEEAFNWWEKTGGLAMYIEQVCAMNHALTLEAQPFYFAHQMLSPLVADHLVVPI